MRPISSPTRLLASTALILALTMTACSAGSEASRDFPANWTYVQGAEPPVTGRRGMVVTTDALASRVGLDVLAAGGNAVDAAVAVHLALAVVNPEAGNIGGGGFLVLHLADGGRAALDFRETAPLAATRDMFLDDEESVTDASLVGHLASGVPGSVAGMWAAHQRYGTLPWVDLVQPAIDLAGGFEVGERFLGSLTPDMVESLAVFPASAAQFLPRDGQPPMAGDTLRQPDLARTLERVRDQGPAGFYEGETADLIVAEMERGGGLITHEDLAAYAPAWREPVSFRYRGHTVISMPPSSSGGATLAEMAHILETYDLSGRDRFGAETLHLFAEAWRRAYADRNHYLADPDFVSMPLARMVSSEYGRERAATIDPDVATPSTEVGPGLGPREEGTNTTHYSIVDEAGNAVSVTTTINSYYGSKVTVAGAGFVLNNEMDDFTAKPGVPNQFGLVQGEANAIEPGKRMLSAMTPTIVLDPAGALRIVTGTPGGSTIITTVFQTLTNVVDFGMGVVDAVHAPRIHHQHLPDQIQFERNGLMPSVVARLEAMGHTVTERRGLSGDVQMIVVEDGVLTGWSDPRSGGLALGH